MIIILGVFLVLLAIYFKNKSFAFVLIGFQILSLVGTFFLGREIDVITLLDVFWLFLTALLLYLIISPWKGYYGVRSIEPISETKLFILTKALIWINSFVFFVFLITAITVMTLVTNVNEFKYGEGVSMQFYYTMLPIPTTFFNISILTYYFSFFILPLHFYYLYKKKYWLSFLCFILSLNIVLYGLTFFSRAVVIQYLMLYSGLLYILYGTMAVKVKRFVRKVVIIGGSIGILYLVVVSQKRFVEDDVLRNSYSSQIPKDALTRDPLLYSYLDYMSQGFLNGYIVMQKYNGEGFGGKLTFESLLAFVSSSESMTEQLKEKQRLWPTPYWYSFTGFAAYAIYDYGVLGSILFGIIYGAIVRKMRPVNQTIQLRDLFLIVLLIQIPLMAIFYNQIGGVMIALILWVGVNLYTKYKVVR